MSAIDTFLSELSRALSLPSIHANQAGWLCFGVGDGAEAFVKPVGEAELEICMPVDRVGKVDASSADLALKWNNGNGPWRIVVDGTGTVWIGRRVDVRATDPEAFIAILTEAPGVATAAAEPLVSAAMEHDLEDLTSGNLIRV